MVKLVGDHQNGLRPSNRDAIGSRLEAKLPNNRKLIRELRCGEGYASQQSQYLHFGLSGQDRISSLSVRWPSGKVSEFRDLMAGSLVVISESGAGPEIRQWALNPTVESVQK